MMPHLILFYPLSSASEELLCLYSSAYQVQLSTKTIKRNLYTLTLVCQL